MEYRTAKRRLDVWFARGGKRRFADVPPELFEQLLSAPKKGAFLTEHIQDRYAS